MHRNATYRSLVGKPAPRSDPRPSLAVILAAHNALTDCADNDRCILHNASDGLNGLYVLHPLNVDSMHISASWPRHRLGPKNCVQAIQIFFCWRDLYRPNVFLQMSSSLVTWDWNDVFS